MLKKYELTNGAAILAEEKHMPIFDEVFNMPGMVKVTGGAALNSARSVAYALKQMGVTESKTDYMGCIGKDERGANLAKLCEEAGVTTHFCESEDKPTGCCAVVIYNKERTLTTDLAAACAYKEDHFDANMEVVKKAKFIYTTGYFITSSMPSLIKAAAYANENDVPFGFNFSAVFLQFIEKDNMMKAIEAADFVFLNEDEAAQFIKTAEMPEGSDLKDVAVKLATWKKTNTKRPRYAMVTYGPKPVIVAKADAGAEAEVKEYPVP
jgi:adenosine kinase